MGLRALLNDLIKWVYEQGLTGVIYNCGGLIGIMLMLVFNVYFAKKYGFTKFQSIGITLVQNILGIVVMMIYAWLLTGFSEFGNAEVMKTVDVSRATVFMPLTLLPIAFFMKIKWSRLCDFFSVGFPLSAAIGKIGCAFAGCCGGYPSSFGIYNIRSGVIVFPIQLIELFIYFMMWFVLYSRAQQQQYRVDGLGFPFYFIIFGFFRFVTDFTRDNEKIFLGCSVYGLGALFTLVVGVILFALIKHYNSSKPENENDVLLITENN